jgi:putative AdoMet-dependent methyltransferase
MDRPAWYYDEYRHSGVDYGDPAVAAEYDRRHRRFRDYRRDAEAVVARLGIRAEHDVIDLGCGTGAFALNAAPHCRTMYAVDVSPAMLECCRKEAAARGLHNIECRPGGFLTYEHAADPVDFVVSTAVLHHLPDFWKLAGLRRAAQMLKPGGALYLFDIVFPDADTDLPVKIDAWIGILRDKAGPEFAAEAETHVRDEYSTYGWVMEGLLARAGFRIDCAEYGEGFGAAYVCTRE